MSLHICAQDGHASQCFVVVDTEETALSHFVPPQFQPVRRNTKHSSARRPVAIFHVHIKSIL